MNRAALFSAFGIAFLALSAAARDDLTSLKGFERGFRRAHAQSSVDLLEPLVCWDNTSPWMRDGMYRALTRGFSYVITRIDISPFKQPPHLSIPDWNVRPTQDLVVWYADDVGQPPFPVHYPLGKKDGKFQFSMVTHSGISRWKIPVPVPPKPVTPADSPYLQRFVSDDFKLVDRTRDIDSGVLALLRHEIGADPRLAEPDQPYQLSDVVEPGNNFPLRRLVLAGHERDLWFIKYIRGGFSPYGVLVIFSRAGEGWKIAFTAYGEFEQNSLEEIRNGVELGKYFRTGAY